MNYRILFRDSLSKPHRSVVLKIFVRTRVIELMAAYLVGSLRSEARRLK